MQPKKGKLINLLDNLRLLLHGIVPLFNDFDKALGEPAFPAISCSPSPPLGVRATGNWVRHHQDGDQLSLFEAQLLAGRCFEGE